MNDHFVQKTIWQQIESWIPQQEHDALKRKIGAQAIEENEELYLELRMLVEILEGYQKETEATTLLLKHRSDPRRETQKAVLQRLWKRLQAKKVKWDKKMREKQLIDYVSESQPQRPTSARSRPSSARSTRSEFSTTSMSTVSSIDLNALDIEYLKPQLNIFNIDTILSEVKAYIAEEKALIESDIEFVNSCLEAEKTYRQQTTSFKQPTLTELLKLEQKMVDLLDQTSPHSTSSTSSGSSTSSSPKQDDTYSFFQNPDVYLERKAQKEAAKKKRAMLKPKQSLFQKSNSKERASRVKRPTKLSSRPARRTLKTSTKSSIASTQPLKSRRRPSSAARLRSTVLSARSSNI